MTIQIEFKTQEDKENILKKYNDWFLLEEMYLLDRNYLFLSKLSQDPSLDEIVREQEKKISILECENKALKEELTQIQTSIASLTSLITATLEEK